MRARRVLAAAALLLAGCRAFSDHDAVELVRRYNARIADAYRAGDVRLVDPLVGDEEGRRLTGLIGVKLDQGITLDARLLELEPTGVARRDDGSVVVSTRERWYYRDRRIGTGEQVGPDSTDRYALRYHLRRLKDRRWVVDRVEFAEPPEVGRSRALPPSEVPVVHGVRRAPAPGAGGGPAGPGPAAGGGGAAR